MSAYAALGNVELGYQDPALTYAYQESENYNQESWAETILGKFSDHDVWKGWWAVLRIAFFVTTVVFFFLMLFSRVDAGSLYYKTRFEWKTDFYTSGTLFGTPIVVQQIDMGPEVQAWSYVSSWLLTIPCILIVTAFFAWFIAFVYNIVMVGRENLTLSILAFGPLRRLFSTPGLMDTSVWLEFEDMCITPFIWGGMLHIFGLNFIWATYFVMAGAVVVRGAAFVTDMDNQMSVDEIRQAESIKNGEFQGLPSFAVTILRRPRPAGLVVSVAGTILFWVGILVYFFKFPYDRMPGYYIGLLVVEMVFELLQHVVFPVIYYGLLLPSLRERRQATGRGWDRYTYDGMRLLCFGIRIYLFIILVRWGDTGHNYVPQIGK